MSLWRRLFKNDKFHNQRNRDAVEILQLQKKAREIRQKSEELLEITERIVIATRGKE